MRGSPRGAVGALRLLSGGNVRAPGAVVLAYHDVGKDLVSPYAVSPVVLHRQLEALRDWGVRFVSLPDLCSRLERSDPLDGLVAVTFDDALEGVRRNALPVLAELGIPATVFAVSRRLGVRPEWAARAGPTMSAAGLRELAAAGVHVGSHSRTHPSLACLGSEPLRAELDGSRRDLEDMLGARVDLFAYPFGDFDARVRHAVQAAGYRWAWTFLNGRITAGLDQLRLPRLGIWGQVGFRFAYHLARPPRSWPETQLEATVSAGSDHG